MFKKLPLYKVIKDIINYISWVKTIKREERNTQSKYNQYGLRRNVFYNVYTVITLESEHMQLHEYQRRQKVVENVAPINRYIDEELRFAEYIVPEFNQVYNEADNTPTPTYVIVYRFAFKYPVFTFIVKRAIFLIVLISILNNVNLQNFIEWVQSLI